MHMNEIEDNDAVSCLTFPALHQVAINRFHLTAANLDSLNTAKGDLRAVTGELTLWTINLLFIR